ncbi:MAG: phosphoserine phosphatase, partial [Colwellia sp.]
MSFIANILSLSLEQYLAKNLQDEQLPVIFSLSEQGLTLGDSDLPKPTTTEQIELVVFQQLSLTLLLALQIHAQLKITVLTTINHRNNQTSCRFQVNCSDFMQARKALA